MNFLSKAAPVLGALALTALAAHPAAAQGIDVTITVNEQGQGTFTNTTGFSRTLVGSVQADPGPGGGAAVLTYDLLNPPGLTAGDLLFPESDTASDIIRFNATPGTLVFYSDPSDGAESLADTPGPSALYENTVLLAETDGGAVYTPTAGQPGFVPGFGVTYRIASDPPAVPEPSQVASMGFGLLGLGGLMLRARRRRAAA